MCCTNRNIYLESGEMAQWLKGLACSSSKGPGFASQYPHQVVYNFL